MPVYKIGDFSVDTDAIEVIGPDGVREVEPQVFDVLAYLVEQPDRLVTKEELLDNVWGDRFVSESALTTRIKQARRALDDDGRTQWAIKTIHGRGYRFVAETEEASEPVATGASPSQQRTPDELPDALRADTRHMFVGRTGELAKARAAVTSSHTEGSFGWLWLLGEPGIGKTRLAAEVAGNARSDGHQVLFGRNSEDLRVPYQPFIEAIRSSIERTSEDQRQAAIDRIPEALDPLLPWDRSTSRPNAVQHQTDDETKRFRLFEAIVSWLVDHAGDAPLTMVIDDVHWAADSTLLLLAHLQQRTQAAPITFVLTARDTAPDVNRKVLDLLAAGQAGATTTVVRLAGLSGEDARRFVGQNVELEEVMRQTAGNPLLLQAVDGEDGSVDIEHAVHRRLANLDEAVKETLQVASILGLEFSLEIAAEATGRDELDLLTDLEHATAARLLDDVGIDRFRFTHALVRSSLRNNLSSARRARLHLRVAEAIDGMADGATRQLQALAFHTAEAAEADVRLRPLAIDRLERSAQQAMDQLSFAEAAGAFQRAHDLADPSGVELRARLTLEQGIALTRAGSSMTAARAFQTAMEESGESGDPVIRIEAALRYEEASWRPGLAGHQALEYLVEAGTILEAAIAGGKDVEDAAELRSRLAIGRVRAAAMSGQTERADQEFRTAYSDKGAFGSPFLEAGLINVYLSQLRFFLGVDEETTNLVKRLGQLRSELDGDPLLHALYVEWLFAVFVGDFEEAGRIATIQEKVVDEFHSKFWAFIVQNRWAMETHYRGDLIAADEHAETCLELANSLPEEDGSGTYGLRMFMIRREQDRLTTMAPLVRHVLSKSEASGVWTPGLAMLLVETGEIDAARQVFEDIKAASFELPLDAIWSTVMVFMIETAVQLGDAPACSILLDKFKRLEGTNVTAGSGLLCFGRAERYLGMLSLTLDDLATAEEYLGTALEADSAGGSALWSNESRLWLSRVRRAQGHPAEADAMVQVVASEAAAAGYGRLERLALAETKTS